VKKLSELKIGQSARVLKVTSSSEEKLYSMGLVPGAEIKLIRKAPIGNDPLEFEIKSYHLSLRKRVCDQVEVEFFE